MSRHTKDLTGLVFGRLTVLAFHSMVKNASVWTCQCDCPEATIKIVTSRHLLTGRTKSCGCLRREVIGVSSIVHGLSRTPENKIWFAMIQRCESTAHKSYPSYGGRGIKVCEEWRASFEKFYEDMGSRPNNTYSLERKNNQGDYCLENCKWSTKLEQANNTRSNHFITYQGRTQTLSQWAKEVGLSCWTIGKRLRRGWSIEMALNK